MDPKAVIESYVDDVVRRLPRRQRADVELELRSLLGEELAGRSASAGRPADEAMAVALLSSFGSPQDVAERYGTGGFLIIRPAAGPGFAWASLIGVAVQWALTLPAALTRQPGDIVLNLGRWWLSWGVGAFWLPGFMVVVAIIAAWIAQRRPHATDWTPRIRDRDRINRPLLALGLAAWAGYMALLAVEPLLLDALPRPLAAAFTFDDAFLRTRGLWLFPVWGGQLLVHVAALVQGRWSRRTRLLSDMFGAGVCAVLAWFVAAGPIFAAKPADDITRAILSLVILLSLVSLAINLYRQQGRGSIAHILATADGTLAAAQNGK
jgi:hypothetical protein